MILHFSRYVAGWIYTDYIPHIITRPIWDNNIHLKIANNRYLGTAFASSDTSIAQHAGHCLILEGIMRFLGIMVVVDCVLVGRMVRSSHAEVCKHFFGLSNPRQTLTFNEVVLPTNTVVTNQYTSLGMPFSP